MSADKLVEVLKSTQKFERAMSEKFASVMTADEIAEAQAEEHQSQPSRVPTAASVDELLTEDERIEVKTDTRAVVCCCRALC
jgi:hypothetical protein